MPRPACMDDTEYAAWQDADRIVRGPDRATSPCRDCTPLWHADMVAGGMCDGVPGPGRLPAHDEVPIEELRALRAQYAYHHAPPELSRAINRWRWRESNRRRRMALA